MRLGLLGYDPAVASVVREAVRAGDTIVSVSDLDPGVAPDLAGARRVDWEHLLDASAADAVLVAADGWGPLRAAAVRALVQAGRPLLLSHPLDLSMLFAYEIDMIRADSGAVLVPFLPDRLHPAVSAARAWLEERRGAVESVHVERRSRDRSRESVLRSFAVDADLVRLLAGPPTRLATLGAADPETAWQTLAVGLSSPDNPPTRWQVVRSDEPGVTFTFTAADGVARLSFADGEQPSGDARVTWTGGAASETSSWNRGEAMLAVLRDAVAGEPMPPRAATWDDAARAIELAETLPRSLSRGRAVDLHGEEFTELGTFKGTMASLGCGIVLLALVVAIGASLVGGIAREVGWEAGERVAGAWPWIVLATMALFLVLQFLPLLVAPSAPDRGRPGKPGNPGDPGRP